MLAGYCVAPLHSLFVSSLNTVNSSRVQTYHTKTLANLTPTTRTIFSFKNLSVSPRIVIRPDWWCHEPLFNFFPFNPITGYARMFVMTYEYEVWRPLCSGWTLKWKRRFLNSEYYFPFWFSLFCSGYGHIHPITAVGKAACIVYAVVGIPFTLIFLSALVQRLLAPTFKLLSSFIKMLPNMDTLQVGNNKQGFTCWYFTFYVLLKY